MNRLRISPLRGLSAAGLLAFAAGTGAWLPARAAQPVVAPASLSASYSYADLADLADRAPTVVRVQIRKVAEVERARAPGLRPDRARMYVEARTLALLAGPVLAGDSLRYLVDVPLDSRGKPPRLARLAKRGVILFARTVPGKPGELQLVAPDAQILWDEPVEARIKALLAELLAPDAPGRIAGVREAIYVPGNLAGEGETQIFLATADGEPASVSVVHRPGKATRWSVSFSEVLEGGGEPPARDTLAWYRLACFLPEGLPAQANVSATDADRAQAEADYRLVRESLGTCPRTRA